MICTRKRLTDLASYEHKVKNTFPLATFHSTGYIVSWTEVRGLQQEEREARRKQKMLSQRSLCLDGKWQPSF